MYYPETTLEMGINAPKAHQRIISKLMASLRHLFYHKHEIALEPLPETQMDEGQASRNDGPPVLDILLYDNETYRTPLSLKFVTPTA